MCYSELTFLFFLDVCGSLMAFWGMDSQMCRCKSKTKGVNLSWVFVLL